MKQLLFRLGALLLVVAPVLAQSPQPAAIFGAADVRVAGPNAAPNGMHGGVLRGNRYEIRNATMLDLIRTAYGVPAEKVTGGPFWLEQNRFDIAALAPPDTTPATLRTMLQALLADRFKAVVREGQQEMAGYLLKSSGKPSLRPTKGDPSNCQLNMLPQGNGALIQHMVCTNMTMVQLANRLPLPGTAADYVPTRLVADQTGVTGAWDFELDWSPRSQLVRAGAEGVTLQQALEKIGLKLEEGTVPTTVFVVDSVNATPTPNLADVAAKLPAPPAPVFEVATVKVSPPEATTPRAQLLPTGQVNMSAAPLRMILNFAWGVPGDEYIVAPAWVATKRYDVVAKAYATPVADAERDGDRLLLMLRQLLVERFNMKYHMENRMVSAFVLTADGPKLTKADPTTRTRCVNAAASGRNPILTRLVTCQNVTMARFAELLPSVTSNYLTGPVTDATGLQGGWDFTINYSPRDVFNQATATGGGGDAAGGATTPSGALSIFDAIDRQLGLKVKPEKRMLPVMVIDSLSEEPDNN